jgi:hypothetical protein
MVDDRDDTHAEGAELLLRSTGPLPPGALDDLRALLRVARKEQRDRLRFRREAIDDVTDPVVASALTLAEDDLEAADARFARIEERRKAAPPPPHEAAKAAKAATARLRATVRAAAGAGVAFHVHVPVEKPVG